MLGEEIGRDTLGGSLPGHGLGTVLAEFERAGVLGIGPRATGTIEAVGLVHLEQRTSVGAGTHLVADSACNGSQCPPTACGALIGFDAGGGLFGHVRLGKRRGVRRSCSPDPCTASAEVTDRTLDIW